ncbi:MAG: hypothetical protein K1X71_01620 [Pirellulales bacterium]|nr:hypothetical protein [Pirellulales bacterium]
MTNANTAEANMLPAGALRTGLSIFLFAHLFAVIIAIVGRGPVPSPLTSRVANLSILAEYRRLLHIDSAYAFPLTRADEFDIDYVIEALVTLPTGEAQTLLMPDSSIAGERARHWRMLGQYMALYLEDADRESLLATGIGQGLIARYDAKDVDLKLKAHYLQDRGGYLQKPDPNRDDLWRDRYEARIWMSGGAPRLLKKENRGEAAPVAESASTPALPPQLPPASPTPTLPPSLAK